jgi:hypothetical protein
MLSTNPVDEPGDLRVFSHPVEQRQSLFDGNDGDEIRTVARNSPNSCSFNAAITDIKLCVPLWPNSTNPVIEN